MDLYRTIFAQFVKLCTGALTVDKSFQISCIALKLFS
jgi:hypothetical protein